MKSILLSIISFLVVGAAAWFVYQIANSKPADQWYETQVKNDEKVSIPADDAPHQAKMEWWYYNGHLTSESGRYYSFHDTTFLVENVMSHMVRHVSLSDHYTGRHFTDQRRTGGNTSIGTKDSFYFVQGDWLMSGGNGRDRIKIGNADFGLDLEFKDDQKPVLHGGNGIISLESAGSSYYYSRPRMTISGTVKVGETVEQVQGIAWFDHQWGDFSTVQLGWDWFSLQLDDGSNVMIYQLRNKQTNQPVNYLCSFNRNGVTELLDSEKFSLIPVKSWTSQKTGITYPVEWEIEIPSYDMRITTRNLINDSEFDARLTTYNIYWEGAITVSGTHEGRGFMELSGY